MKLGIISDIHSNPTNIHDNKRNMSLKEIQNHKWTHSRIGKFQKDFLENFLKNKIFLI